MDELTDGELVQAARAGVGEAFSVLYHRYARYVHSIALARAESRLADDLVQEAFLKAWEHLVQLRQPDRFRPWLATIARNLAAGSAAPAADSLPEELVAPQAGDRLAARELLQQIQQMPDPYRETLTMRLVEGLTGPEIAQLTGMTPGSVRVHLHRGMKKLQATLLKAGWP